MQPNSRSIANNKPFFSVIIPTFNRAHLLNTAIDSILGQTFQNFEIIIVDDHSSDNTKKIIKKQTGQRVRYFSNKVNKGKGGARNVGIEKAKGKYICFLDDDDYYYNNHLSVFYNEIVKCHFPKALLFTLPVTQARTSGKIEKMNLPPIGDLHPVTYLFSHKTPVATSRACIHSDILNNFRFNEKIMIGQDTELFMRIAAKYEVIRIEAYTIVSVWHEDNSGSLKYNAGKHRLEGFKYIFSNPELKQYVPLKLKCEMYSYANYKAAQHYEFKHEYDKMYFTLLKSLLYNPWDAQIKNKMVMLAYHAPGGVLIKRLVRGAKKFFSTGISKVNKN